MTKTKLCTLWSRPGVQFQVVSDLHLEHCSQYSQFRIPVKAPYLILAGDIGKLTDYDLYLNFLTDLARGFRRIFLVLGETEYFGAPYRHARHLAHRLQQEPVLEGRVALLLRKRFDLAPDLTILGCTLGTDIARESHPIVEANVKDFKHIAGWTVADHVAEHRIDVEWLESEVCVIRKERGPDHKILVITHHAPMEILPLEHDRSPEAATCGTPLLGSGSWLDQVQYWVFGHTGLSTESRVGITRLISNQRGFLTPFEDSDTATTKEFRPGLLKKMGQRKQHFDVGKVVRI